MKIKTFLWVLTALLLSNATLKRPGENKYLVDVEKSTIQWTGFYVFSFGSHTGTVKISEGALYVAGNKIVKGAFEIDMQSIQDLDMKGDGGGPMLTDHLKSDDFFSVDKFPKARFEILQIEKIKDATPGQLNYTITGELTVENVTDRIEFPAMVSVENEILNVSAKFKFDRTKWNIRYKSGRFFDDVGDGAISGGIGIELNIIAHP